MIRRCINGFMNCVDGSLCEASECGTGERSSLASSETSQADDKVERQMLIPFKYMDCKGLVQSRVTSPISIAIDSKLNVIVGDSFNDRIQVVDRKFGLVSSTGACKELSLVTVNAGKDAVVAVNKSNEIMLFDDAMVLETVIKPDDCQIPIRAIAADKDGNIFVVRTEGELVMKYSPAGIREAISCENLNSPVSVTTHRGNIYLADSKDSKIKVYTYDGVFIREMGGPKITEDIFAVRVTESGSVLVGGYVVYGDSRRFDLTTFDASGKLLELFHDIQRHDACRDMCVYQKPSDLCQRCIVVICDSDKLYYYQVELPKDGKKKQDNKEDEK